MTNTMTMKKNTATETEQPEVYRTNSLPLASYLCTCKGINFSGISKETSLLPNTAPTVFFLFKPFDGTKKLADKYFTGEATVSPMELFKNYRALKDMVFETKRNPDA